MNKPRYRKISVRIWSDAKCRKLSPIAKLVWLYILTNPDMRGIGAMEATIPDMALKLGIPEKAFRDAFKEVLQQGLFQYDENAHLIVVPNFLKHNYPESPNVVKSWMSTLDELPECDLLTLYFQQVKAFIEGLSKGFIEALQEGFGEALPKALQEGSGDPSLIQEHLHLHSHLQKPLQPPPLPPKGQDVDTTNSFLLNQVVDAWNVMASKCGLSSILKLTESRKTHLKARLQEPIFQKGWKDAISKIPQSDFLCGRIDKATWKADFEFFLRPDSVVKIIEGKYDNKTAAPPKENVPLNRYTRFAKDRLEEIKYGRWDMNPETNPGEQIYQEYKAKGYCE